MAYICKFDVNKARNRGFYCTTTLKSGGVSVILQKTALLDTGATTCHMSFPLWCGLGFNNICFDQNKAEFVKIGINSPDDMIFESMPLKSFDTILGNGLKTKTYEFRVDELMIGDTSGLSKPITLTNITIRVMDSPDYEFIIGLNVLRYLTIKYQPSALKSICNLTLDSNGKKLLDDDRINYDINNMSSMFHR